MGRSCFQRDPPGSHEHLRAGQDWANLGRARTPSGTAECDRPYAARNCCVAVQTGPILDEHARQPERWNATGRTLRATAVNWHSLDQPDEGDAAGLKPRAKDTKACGLAQSAPVGALSSAVVVSQALHVSPKIPGYPGSVAMSTWRNFPGNTVFDCVRCSGHATPGSRTATAAVCLSRQGCYNEGL